MKQFDSYWYERTGEAQEYLGLNIDDVEKVNQQWSQITELVDQGDLDNWAMINQVKQNLTEDQDASLRSLLEEGNNIPYEEVIHYQKECEQRVETLRNQIQDLQDSISEQQVKLMRQKEILQSIAPEAASDLDLIADDELKKIKQAEIAVLAIELDKAELDLEFANDLFRRTGRAWPIPSLADVHYEPRENEVFTVDQFPNEREEISERIVEKVTRKFESRLSDASSYLALLLKEKPGHIWRSEELAQAIYDDGGEDANRDSSRISALISNYRHGKVPAMAEVFGSELVLQRGKRQLFDAKTGKSIPRTIKVVWRLVDIETAVNAQIITTLNSERTLRESYGEWEPADVDALRLSGLPSGDYDGKSLVLAEPDEPSKIVEENSVQESRERSDWREDFTNAVHETIESLKDAGVMDNSEISWSLLRSKTDSKMIGTKTAQERAVKVKIIKKSQLGENVVITIPQAIQSILQNNFPNVFRVSSRQKEAQRIVEEIVDGYFRTHEIS